MPALSFDPKQLTPEVVDIPKRASTGGGRKAAENPFRPLVDSLVEAGVPSKSARGVNIPTADVKASIRYLQRAAPVGVSIHVKEGDDVDGVTHVLYWARPYVERARKEKPAEGTVAPVAPSDLDGAQVAWSEHDNV